MFDPESAYEFRVANKKTEKKGEIYITEYKFTFFCRFNHQYIVNVEEYGDLLFFAIKFHLKNHTDSDRKYKVMTKLFDVPRVLSTCIRIMMYFYDQNPFCSFGFRGEPSEGEDNRESNRFRIYRQVMKNVFSPQNFIHYDYPDNSMYLLINRNHNDPDLFSKIESMIDDIYDLSDSSREDNSNSKK